MTLEESTLEWDGLNLYRVSGTRREFIGTIVRNSFREDWSIWIRSEAVRGGFPSEELARAALEKYA